MSLPGNGLRGRWAAPASADPLLLSRIHQDRALLIRALSRYVASSWVPPPNCLLVASTQHRPEESYCQVLPGIRFTERASLVSVGWAATNSLSCCLARVRHFPLLGVPRYQAVSGTVLRFTHSRLQQAMQRRCEQKPSPSSECLPQLIQFRVGPPGFEPGTFAVSARCSNRAELWAIMRAPCSAQVSLRDPRASRS